MSPHQSSWMVRPLLPLALAAALIGAVVFSVAPAGAQTGGTPTTTTTTTATAGTPTRTTTAPTVAGTGTGAVLSDDGGGVSPMLALAGGLMLLTSAALFVTMKRS